MSVMDIYPAYGCHCMSSSRVKEFNFDFYFWCGIVLCFFSLLFNIHRSIARNVRLSIVNLVKCGSLYNEGMRPLMYSEIDAKDSKIGWRRCGENIAYFKNEDSSYVVDSLIILIVFLYKPFMRITMTPLTAKTTTSTATIIFSFFFAEIFMLVSIY